MVKSILYIILGLLTLYIKSETLNGITVLNITYGDSYQENNYELTVFEGDEFALKFETNPSTGYSWTFVNEQNLGDNIQLINKTNAENSNSKNLLGQPANYYLFFKAIKKTTQPKNLNFVYKRSWEEELWTNTTVVITVSDEDSKKKNDDTMIIDNYKHYLNNYYFYMFLLLLI